jgi:plasmid stabilization system protein ParE
MKSGLKINWSPEAIQNLESILAYLKENWTQKEISRFLIKFEKQLVIISRFPLAYPQSSKNKVFIAV